MKIYDIPQATKISINMTYHNYDYIVEATVLTRYGDGILVTPITCDGFTVDICNSATFEYKENYTDKKRMFKVDNISRVDFAGSDFHVITGKEIVIANNQRKAERYMVQAIGNASINKNHGISVVVHDISMRGFSLMVGNKTTCQIGDKVKVEFGRESVNGKVVLEGIVVRRFDIGGYESLGCELDTITPRVMSYIMEKKEEHQKKKQAESLVSNKVVVTVAG